MALLLSSQCTEPVTPAQLLGEEEPEEQALEDVARDAEDLMKAIRRRKEKANGG